MTKKLNLANLSKNELTQKEMLVTGGIIYPICRCYCYCECPYTFSTYNDKKMSTSSDSMDIRLM